MPPLHVMFKKEAVAAPRALCKTKLSDILLAESRMESKRLAKSSGARFTAYEETGRRAVNDGGCCGLSGTLQAHQLQGVGFIMSVEQGSEAVPIGGIIADEMGTGKTLTVLSHIAVQLSLGERHASLIVVPASIAHQWMSEIAKFLPRVGTRALLYHGKGKEAVQRGSDFNGYDYVVTTYETLAGECPKDAESENGGSLYRFPWARIILDEAHRVRNMKTRAFKCCLTVAKRSQHVWCLTGTPVVNKPADIQAYAHLISESTNPESVPFLRHIERMTKKGKDRIYGDVGDLLGPLMIRRKKSDEINGRVIVELPKVKFEVEYLEFTPTEQQVYNKLYAQVSEEIAALVEASDEQVGTTGTMMHILALLTYVRQYCDSPKMVRDDVMKLLEIESVGYDKELHTRIMQIVHAEVAFEPQTIVIYDSDDEDVPIVQVAAKQQEMPLNGPSSSKVLAVVHDINETFANSGTEKTIVFSNFVKALNEVGTSLDRLGISFMQIDGSVAFHERAELIAHFGNPNSKTRVMLASTNCCNVGLNLTMASHGIIMDPWYNAAGEDQAIGRMDRYGQTRQVSIKKYLMKDSFEVLMHEMQLHKKQMAEEFLVTGGNTEYSGGLSLKDVRQLFPALG